MKRTIDMSVGNPVQNILRFSVPVLLGTLFQQLYNMADTIVVGRFLGADALAAVGSTGSTVYLVIGFTSGLTQGFTILMIEHDMNIVMNISDRVYVMDYGKVIASGTPREVISNPDVIRAYLGESEEEA